MYEVKYLDYLGAVRTGKVVAEIATEDPECPYLLIQDENPDYNYHMYGDIPYADMRHSDDCEFIGG